MLSAVAPRPCSSTSTASPSWGAGPAERTGCPECGSAAPARCRDSTAIRADCRIDQQNRAIDCVAVPHVGHSVYKVSLKSNQSALHCLSQRFSPATHPQLLEQLVEMNLRST